MRGVPRPQQGDHIPGQSNPHYPTTKSCNPCVGQNNSTNSTPYKTPYKFCAQSLSMVGLTLQARKRKYGLSES